MQDIISFFFSKTCNKERTSGKENVDLDATITLGDKKGKTNQETLEEKHKGNLLIWKNKWKLPFSGVKGWKTPF